MRKAVVVVAGGKGLRMGGDIPKQFLPVGGVPVLMRTLMRFRDYDEAIQIVLVLPESQQEYWHSLCDEYDFKLDCQVANGGETRFHSVRNGLAKVDDDVRLIAVHDGVRPFVSLDTISACFDEASRRGAVVPVIDVVETVRHLEGDSSVTVPRDEYKLVQTPQVFDAALLRKAYEQTYRDFFTDDASVVESLGHDVALVAGNRENIKITTPYDMVIGECLSQRL